MRRVVLVLAASAALGAACGGPQVPPHNGYKADVKKPWKKAKDIKLDDKGEAKADGSLSYGEYKRAHWYALDLPQTGALDLKLDITPPGDATNDDFDLAWEILDPGSRVISKSDLEESDAHELAKVKKLVDLVPGHYLIHVYLQGRMDTADFSIHVAYHPTAKTEVKSDFPAQVAFLPALSMVPIQDEAPKNYKPTPAAVVTHVIKKGHPDPVKPPPPPPVAGVTARILQVNVVSGGTQIVIGRGTESGANDKMHGKINGTSISFTVAGCSPRTCTAVVTATPDQIKASSGDVSMSN